MSRKVNLKENKNTIKDYFQIGDEVIEILKLQKSKGQPISIQSAFIQVSKGYKYAGRTVRDAYSIASRFSEEISEKHLILSTNHFRTAISLRKENPSEVLDWCLAQRDSQVGQPAFVKDAMKKFAPIEKRIK